MTEITKLPLFVIREMWLDGELSDAGYTAEVQRRNDETLSLRSRAEKAEAERDELAKAIDSVEIQVGITSNGNLWRFWSMQAKELAAKNTAIEATCEKLAAALSAAEEVVNVAEQMTSSRSDDDWVWGVQAKIKAALSAYRSVTTVNASGPKGETPENCRDGGADAT